MHQPIDAFPGALGLYSREWLWCLNNEMWQITLRETMRDWRNYTLTYDNPPSITTLIERIKKLKQKPEWQ